MDDEEIHDNCTECNAHLWSRAASISGICPEFVDEAADEMDNLLDLEDRLEAALADDVFAVRVGVAL